MADVAAAPEAEVPLAERIRQRREAISAAGGYEGYRARREVQPIERANALASEVGQSTLGEPGLPNLGVRADIGFSTNFEERRAKFLNSFPDGDFIQVPDPADPKNPIALFRRNQEEPYAKVDADMTEKWEIFGDLADVSGDVPAIVLEAIFTKGRGLLRQALGAFFGGFTGEVTKKAIDELRGYNNEDVQTIVSRATGQGLQSAAGAISTVAVTGPLNWLKGAPAVGLVEGAGRAQTAAAALHMPRLHPGQITSWPILQKLSNLAREITPDIRRYETEQQAAAARALMALRDKDVDRALAGDLSNLHEEARQQIITAAVRHPEDLTKGGTGLQSGVAEYDDLSTLVVNKKYTDARALETPIFDPAPLRAVADNLEARANALGQELPKDVVDAIGRIRAFDPNAPDIVLPDGSVIDATEQLKAIRTDLWHLKTIPPGADVTPERRRAAAEAGSLYSAITRTLNDPKNTTPEFRKAWSDAANEARIKFETMDKLVVIGAMKSESPARLALRLARPHAVDDLMVLKKIMPEERWAEFQNAAMSHFVSPAKIDGITKTLKSFDQPTLDTLFSAEQQKALRTVGEQMDRLADLDLPGILARQERRGNIAYDVFMKNDRTQIETFNKMVGSSEELRTEVRAGLIDAMIFRNLDRMDGVPVIKWKNFNADLTKLVENGGMRFLKPSDVRTLRDLKFVSKYLPDVAEAGTSIAATEAASGAARGHMGALFTIARMFTVGKLMTSEKGQRLLLGTNRGVVSNKEFDVIRAAGAIAAEIADDIEGYPAPPKEQEAAP